MIYFFEGCVLLCGVTYFYFKKKTLFLRDCTYIVKVKSKNIKN